MRSAAESRGFDRLRGDEIQIALPGKLLGPSFLTKRESGTLIVTDDRLAFFTNRDTRATWSVQYTAIESIEVSGFPGRRMVAIHTMDGPVNIGCNASKGLISQLEAFVRMVSHRVV